MKTSKELAKEIAKPVNRVIVFIQLIAIITFIAGLFYTIWGNFFIGIKVLFTCFFVIIICYLFSEAYKKAIHEQVEEEIDKQVDKIKESKFQKRLSEELEKQKQNE
jgi:uncharacterized membrane protein